MIINNRFLFYIKKILRLTQHNLFYFEKISIFERDLSLSIKDKSKLKLSFKFISERELDLLDAEKYFLDKKRKKFFFDRLNKGDGCLVAIFEKQIIGYFWMMINEMEISEKKHISLPDTKVYLYNGYVINQYRGKKVIGALREYYVKKLRNDGKKYSYISIPSHNISSIKSLNNTTINKLIGNIIHIKFLFLEYSYISKKLQQYIQNA